MRWVALALLAAAIFPPFVGVLGPLSLDDLLPLIAVLILFPSMLSGGRPSDPVFLGFAFLAAAGLLSAAVNARDLGELLRCAGRGSGRAIFYAMLVHGVQSAFDPDRCARGDATASRIRRAVTSFLVVAASIEATFCVLAFVTEYRGPLGLGLADVPEWSVLKGHSRVQGTFGGELGPYDSSSVSANFLAAYLVLVIPPTVALGLAAQGRALRVAIGTAAALMVVALYLTYTRAALAALAVAILAFGFFMGRRREALLAVVLGVVTALAVPTMRQKILSEGHDRYALWSAAVAVIAEHPLTGVGDGNYLATLERDPVLAQSRFGLASTTAHNSIMLSAAHHGIPGGVAHALLDVLALVSIAIALGRAKGEARLLAAGLAAGFIGFLVQDQSNDLSYVPKVATQAWLVFALLPVIARPPRT